MTNAKKLRGTKKHYQGRKTPKFKKQTDVERDVSKVKKAVFPRWCY